MNVRQKRTERRPAAEESRAREAVNVRVLKSSNIRVLRNVQYFLKGVGSKRDAAILQGCFSEVFSCTQVSTRAQMRPSADGGQRAREVRTEDFVFVTTKTHVPA